MSNIADINAILAYHSQTKHHLHRFASSSGYLDWATQPNPFRTFAGAEKIALPLLSERLQSTYCDLYIPGAVAPAPVDLNSIGILFELSLGLSAWKQYGQTRWALRCNPSSGNLHPTEGYAILPPIPGLITAGVYHYASHDHQLEQRAVIHDTLPVGSCIFIGLTSIHWREAWKYGERAFRYCQHDMGHAIAAVRYAAAGLGWSATMIDDVSDAAVSDMLGLSDAASFREIAKPDREHPGAFLRIGPHSSREVDIARLQDALKSGVWTGRANSLSPGHVEWPAIDEAAEASRKVAMWKMDPSSISSGIFENPPSHLALKPSQIRAAEIIKQRRSAVALDDVTSIPAESFYGILDRLLPRPSIPPWDAWPSSPGVHCGIFVHRVDGLSPGLYLFERNETAHENLRKQLDPSFAFERPAGCPENLRLFRMVDGDFRRKAQIVSCQQKIAGAGAFSLGMLAEFDESIHMHGAWWYRRLFWECGILGHVFYLEAEAAGVRGTGIGCYFDDVFHEMLGFKENEFQSLYHFTIGGPVEDTRLMTVPGYAHLDRSFMNGDIVRSKPITAT